VRRCPAYPFFSGYKSQKKFQLLLDIAKKSVSIISMNETLLALAQSFARDAHDSIGQTRKYEGGPYWAHTERVADMVRAGGGDEAMICAAYLHDVLEDVTPKNSRYSLDLINAFFGSDITALVIELTDVWTSEANPTLNRKMRKALECERLARVSNRAKFIKLCDLIDNTDSIAKHDPGFARVYLAEKAELLKVLRCPMAENLWAVAMEQVAAEKNQK
jgi:(p)ppGpp synthase/HD superfamily hydrolase